LTSIETKLTSILLLLLFFFSIICNGQDSLHEVDFKTPPASVKVNTWWHWLSSEITKEGITKDLESMKQQGIVQATILNVGGLNSKRAGVKPVIFNSPEWHEMFKWALTEANRLDIKIGVHNCDGWSTSGGPWITPDQSMKKFVWSQAFIEGGKDITTKLSQPAALENYYREVAVVAIPIEKDQNSYQLAKPAIEVNKVGIGTKLNDGNPTTEINIKKGDIIQVTLAEAIEATKLVVFPHLIFSWDDMSKIKNQYTVSTSTDGVNYNKLAEPEFIGVNKSLTANLPATKSRYFKIECINGNTPLAELEILKDNELQSYAPQVPYLLEKTSSLNALQEKDYDFSTPGNSSGIAENAVIDITGKMSADGTLNWKAPKGKWQIIRFGYTTTGVKNGPATPEGTGLEADKMDSSALNFHFNNFAGKLLKTAGNFTGNTFKFLLIDSWECQYQTWTQTFPEEFKIRRGYSIIPWIPVLCGQTIESTTLSEAFLHDYRKTIADLIDENYYKHFSKLCHQNKLEMHAEIIYANSGMYPPLDAIKSNKYVDLPMTEFWASPNSEQFPQYNPEVRPVAGFPTFASLACNKPIIGSEAYTGYAHYSESPYDLKPFGDAAYCSGINQMILHSYVHQPTEQKPGITLGQFAAHFNRNNPWWEYTQDWMNYQARVQYVLQKGEPEAEILFFIGDQLPQYFGKSILNELPYGFQATVCNFEMLTEAKVVENKISFGGIQSYPLLTLPKSTAMEFATLKRLAELVNEGAVIYGPKPLELISAADRKSHGAEFNKLANELWGISSTNKFGKGTVISGKAIAEVLKDLSLEPALASSSNDPKEIMFIHKIFGDMDIYYLFNQQKKEINREITFRVAGKTPEIWDPQNGSITRPVIYSLENNQLRLPLNFKAYEAKIIVFKKGIPVHFIQKVTLGSNQLFPSQQAENTVPQAEYKNGKYAFITQTDGDFIFTTNDNQSVKANLVQPKEMEIKNFKGKIEFSSLSNEVIQPLEITQLQSLTEFTDPPIKYFAGKVKYTISFSAPDSYLSAKDSITLNLGNLDATAMVILNGKLVSYSWLPNSPIAVSGLLKKENKLEITVATVCRNRFIGDLAQVGSVKSLWTTSPIETILKKDMVLKPSGLMGPMKLTNYSQR